MEAAPRQCFYCIGEARCIPDDCFIELTFAAQVADAGEAAFFRKNKFYAADAYTPARELELRACEWGHFTANWALTDDV